jgi:hypothetical protein
MWHNGGIIVLGERRRDPREICPVPLLSATNTTWTDLGSNQGLRDEKPATSRLSHDTTCHYAEIRVCKCKGFSSYLVENTIRFNYRSEPQKAAYKKGTLVYRRPHRHPIRVWLQDSLIMKLRDGAGNRIIVTQQTVLNVFTSTLSR